MLDLEKLANLRPSKKIPTGIEGFEHISQGGLPQGRATLVTGSSGSGKTLFCTEFLYRSITEFDRPCVYVTMEEPIEDVVKNVLDLGWGLADFAKEGKLGLIDASMEAFAGEEIGAFNLKGLISQIKVAIEKINAEILLIDSIGALFHHFHDERTIRREILRIVNTFKKMDVTVILTSERLDEYGHISRHGVEEFVADNVIILRSVLEEESVRRTIQILKMRGNPHIKGEFPITISYTGLSIMALSAMELKQSSSNVRCSFGNKRLDEMTNGGIFRDSILLVSGPTGGGKTLMCATFVEEACRNDEKILIFAYEESRQQLMRNAHSWGIDFEKWEKKGLLKVICHYPEAFGLEEHLLMIQREIIAFKPRRLVMDSVSAMERVSTVRNFREFVIGLTSFVKQEEVCSLFTSTTPRLSGGDSITEAHISTITDIIILLRYVEVGGAMRRGLAVIKMRGSQHEKEIREFEIDQFGMHIGEPFKNVQNIILGVPQTSGMPEVDRLEEMFAHGE